MTNKETDWDTRYLENDTPWDKGGAAPALLHLVDDDFFPQASRILVPGCGIGHDVAVLAEAGFEALGLDVSRVAIERAENANAVPGASFLCGDLFVPESLESGAYDVIWEHTCYCAILPTRRGEYVESVHRLLKPGGRLIGLFFTDTQMPEGQGPPHETSRDEVVDMFSPYFTLLCEQAPPDCYSNRVGREWLMVWEKPELSQ